MTSRLLSHATTLSALSAALLGSWLYSSDARANQVTDSNAQALVWVNEQSPMEQSRSLAIVQLAVHDALNAIQPRYARYALRSHAPGAAPEAAILAAAHDTLLAVAPAKSAEIESWYARALAALPEGAAKTSGVEIGRAAAARMLGLRAGDDVAGALAEPYEAGDQPGSYRATPPFDIVVGAGWGELRTFATPRASAFRPQPPVPVTSPRYAREYEEVKTIGVQGNSSRTPEQTQIADFWYESSVTGWLRITNTVIAEQGLDLWKSARVSALVSMALADGFINGFDAKYHYDYWRPITAIRAGDADGNRRTQGDASWTPYCVTPPVADYPSTHSVLGAAAAAVLARVFGDGTHFTADSLSLANVTRSFDSFSLAARENGDSRLFCGIHWPSSIHAGLEQGRRIGNYVFEHQLEPTQHR